ncbi:MAG: hypothetical protein MI974_20075 [Chitinophagales bacterium]|nr:hypothetical protein [Chitinophagales bacterium]
MKIKSIEIYKLAIPLKIQFAQANNKSNQSCSIIVKLQTQEGISGFGECCPRKYVTGESPEDVIKALKAIQGALYQYDFVSINAIQEYVCEYLPGVMKPAAICALELALLDAWSKEYQIPLVNALGGTTTQSIPYTGIVPLGPFPVIASKLKHFNFTELKLKASAGLEDNLKRIQEIKSLYTSNIKIRVDANTGWTFPTAIEQCKSLIEAGVSCIEQPFPADADKSMQLLKECYGEWIDIMADESLTDFQTAEALIDQQACNRFNLKISKNGGIFNTLKIYKLAQQHGIKCQLGAHFGETSLLTAAGLIFASIAPKLVAIEGGLGTHLLAKDITLNPLMINQEAIIPRKIDSYYGLGLTIDEEILPAPEKNTQPLNV